MIAAERRIAANPVPPPSYPAPLVRVCGACTGPTVYLDYDLGRDAHEVVFGHQPVQAEAAQVVR
jgi:hypothetical protein